MYLLRIFTEQRRTALHEQVRGPAALLAIATGVDRYVLNSRRTTVHSCRPPPLGQESKVIYRLVRDRAEAGISLRE
jgi:hypothetical protein